MKHAFLFSALLASSMSYAGSSFNTQAVQLNLLSGNIPQQRQQIEAKLGEIEYTELTNQDRQVLKQLFALIESSASGPNAKQAEERINGILQKTFDDSKLVCTHEKPLGSNMIKKSCMTAAAKRLIYDKTRRSLEMENTVVNP